ncbi:MAG: CidA/LrgA family protein [Pontibacterium sp.]
MLRGFLLFTLFFLLGESISFLLALPVSGSVIGMLLLTLWLMLSRNVEADLVNASQQLISVLIIFIMPGVAGVFFLSSNTLELWVIISLAMILGTLFSVLTSLLLMRALTPVEQKADNHE